MIYEEFYIDGKEVDIKDVNVQTLRRTPYFGDLSKITQNTTLTITLPPTERNKAVMEYLNEHDAATDFPYKKHEVNYFVDGVQKITNGSVSVFDDFEIQVIYGIDKELYSTLNEKKLNEMEYTGSFYESNWLVDWNKSKMFASAKKYQYLKYIKGKRTSDVEITGGVISVKADVDTFFASDVEEMSQHPFILASYILDAIGFVSGLPSDIFTKLNSRLTDIGLILSGNKDNYSKTITYTHSGNSFNSNKLFLGYETFNGMFIKSYYNITPKTGLMPFMEATIEFDLNLSITGSNNLQYVNSLLLVGSWFDPEIGAEKYDVLETIPYTSIDSQYLTFTNVKVIYKVDATSFKYTAGISIMFGRNTNKPLSYLLSIGSKISTTFKSEKSVYCFPDYNGNTFGRYNTVANLPEISALDFIKSIAAYTGAFIGEDFDTYYLEEFKTNLTNGNVLNWSGRISNVVESEYNFNGSAKKNYIKFSNDEDIPTTINEVEILSIVQTSTNTYATVTCEKAHELSENSKIKIVGATNAKYNGNFIISSVTSLGFRITDIAVGAITESPTSAYLTATNKYIIEVNDETLENEKDMFVLPFDSPDGGLDKLSEFVLYEQDVKGEGTAVNSDTSKVHTTLALATPYYVGDLHIGLDSNRNNTLYICTVARGEGEAVNNSDWSVYPHTVFWKGFENVTIPYYLNDIVLASKVTFVDGKKVYTKTLYICTITERTVGAVQAGDFELYDAVYTSNLYLSIILPPYNKGDIWITTDITGKKLQLIANTSKSNTEEYSDDDWDYYNNKQTFTTNPTVPYFKLDTWYDDDKIYIANTDNFDAFNQDDWDLQLDIESLGVDITALQNQVDKKAETFYQATQPNARPTITNQTPTYYDNNKMLIGDLWYDTTTQKTYVYRAFNTGTSNEYTTGNVDFRWVQMDIPIEVFDTIDGKSSIFVSEPSVYKQRDLWILNGDRTFDIDGGGTKLYKLGTILTSSSDRTGIGADVFTEIDWAEKVRYTDDSSLNTFVSGAYATTIAGLNTQIDKKAETYYQDTPPYSNVTGKTLVSEWDKLVGDLWYDTTTQKTYIYNKTLVSSTYSFTWVQMDIPIEVFDTIDGKSSIFIIEPSNYKANDLWILSANTTVNGTLYKLGTILTSSNDSLTYVESHWTEKVKYTDDTALATFISSDYAQDIESLNNQIDLKAETYYQDGKPHLEYTGVADTPAYNVFVGDLWYCTASGANYKKTFVYRKIANSSLFNYVWVQMEIPADIFDKFDGKSSIFVSEPSVYKTRDLWILAEDREFDIYASTSKITYNAGTILTSSADRTGVYPNLFSETDWTEKVKYTDDSLIDEYASDGIYSPIEKKAHRVEWENRLKEKWQLSTQATSFGITTEYTNFNAAFVTLSTYLNGGTTWTAGIPLWLGTELTKSQGIDATTFRTNWNNMYSTLAILKNKIAEVAKEYDPFFIGGYNFIKNSNLAKGLVDGWAIYNANNNEIIYTGLPSGATHGYKFKSISGFGGVYFLRSALKIVAGKKYTLSFYVKADSVCEMQYGDEGIIRGSVTLTSTWQRVVQTFTASTSSNISFYVDLNDDFTYVTNFQLEAGSNVSDWNNNPDTKLSALDYLREAMTDEAGFETVGGLALAKVILVRGSDTVIRGGLSGLETDELLLWGGTYQDALDGKANVVIKKGGEFFLGGEQNRRKVEVTMQNLGTLDSYINRNNTDVTMYSSSPKTNFILFQDVNIYNYKAIAELMLNGTTDSKQIVLSENGLLSLNVKTTHEVYENTQISRIDYISYVLIRKIFDANGNPVNVQMWLDEKQDSHDFDAQNISHFFKGAELVGSIYLEKGTYIIEARCETNVPYNLIPETPLNEQGYIYSTVLWSGIKYSLIPAKTVLAANGFACVRDEYNYFYLSQAIGSQFLNGRGNMQWLSEDGTKGLRVTNEGVQKYNGSTWVTL